MYFRPQNRTEIGMFSIEYFNGSAIVSAFSTRRINFMNVEKLRKLVMQVLKQDCQKCVLDIEQVNFIDSKAFEVLMHLAELANHQGVELKFLNVGEEVHELLPLVDQHGKLSICTEEEELELAPVSV